MKKFATRIISGEGFNDHFFQLDQTSLSECSDFVKELRSETVKDFQINIYPIAYDFAHLMSLLKAECDNFTGDYGNEEFYNSIKRCFLKLQKALNEE